MTEEVYEYVIAYDSGQATLQRADFFNQAEEEAYRGGPVKVHRFKATPKHAYKHWIRIGSWLCSCLDKD